MRDIEGNVSRETLQDLRKLEKLIRKWNAAINLVSRSTLPELWERHILDSLQLWPLLPAAQKLVDFGTGGGFPGLILAVAAKHDAKIDDFTFIESDKRKAAFLMTSAKTLALNVQVIADRIEDAALQEADIATARALAPCGDLLAHSALHLKTTGKSFFLKGETAEQEITDASKNWRFSLVRHPSKTNEKSTILEIGELSRV